MPDEATSVAPTSTPGNSGTGAAPASGTQAPAASSTPAVTVVPSAATSNAATEATSTGTAPAAATPGKTEPAATEVAYDLKLPTGALLTKEALPQLAAVAKTLGLSQDQAQKFVDHQNTLAAQATKEQEAAWAKTTSEWDAAVKADPVIGGANLDASKRDFDTALGKADKEFRELLEKSGYVAHPAVRRELSRMGKLMREDGFSGNGGGGTKASEQESLAKTYPTMFSAAT